MSVPQSNSTQMIESPMPEADRTRRTSLAPFIADSIGKVTSVSTSSGARPCASTMIVTVGRFRLGKTSIGSWAACRPP
jgi:tRNA U34 5-carboxymethylaminomethyl modifying enzyme MnmG/GidA